MIKKGMLGYVQLLKLKYSKREECVGGEGKCFGLVALTTIIGE